MMNNNQTSLTTQTLLIFCNLLFTLYAQPCTTPQTLIGTTQISGSCASDIASTTATDFDLAALGGSTINNGVTQFAIAMWIKPGKTSSEAIATYTLFRVTTDAADTTPSSTKGVRFSAFISSHTTDSLNRGFQLGYSETPSSFLVMTDITQFLISFNYNWMYVYAALNYDTGDMQLTVWQSSETFYKQQTYQASKVNFNDPLDDNTMINVMYWGSYLRYCGNMAQVKWMPGYYETINDNILTLAYFLEGKTNTEIYLFRFDTEDSTTVTNLIDSNTVTVTGTQTNAYYEITPTDRIVTVSSSGVWTYTSKSYTFGIHFLFKQLPVFGQDIIIFQRKNGASNKLNIRFARQVDGKIGILLVLQATSQLIYSSLMNQDQYYYLLLSMSFKDSVPGQTNVLVHYSLVGQDGDFTKHGFVFVSYTSDFSTQMVAADTVTLGAIANIYPNSVYIRNFRFTEGFEAFIGVPTNLVNCLDNCVIGFYTQITTDTDYCLICDSTTKLDSDYQCVTGQCSADYYPVSDLVSQTYCGYCLTTSYYVSIAETCIEAICGNGFKEALEQCDDGNLDNLDGCDDTCNYEAGWICNAIAFQLSVCQKQCGNGQEDIGDTGNGYPAYSEACDDGNISDNDGCDQNCDVESNLWECLPYFPTVCSKLCGNSIIDNNVILLQTEQCDDGNQDNNDGCSDLCQIEIGWYCNLVGTISSCNRICGNGIIDGLEQCDDGNLIDNDGCTNCIIDIGYVCAVSICTKLCGNGIVDVSNSEICDDGNTIDFDGCTNCLVDIGWNCIGTSPTICQLCGNGKKEGTETCDDGNTISFDGCSLGCIIELNWTCNGNNPDQCKNCGDGKKQQIEDCDDGNSLSGDGCFNCLIEPNFQCSGGSPSTPDICIRQCPNGIVAANEQCDDGNFNSGDGCFNCLIELGYVCVNQPSVCNIDICGNGLSNNIAEQCDDGNIENDDGCSSSCLIETGWKCSGQNYQNKSTCIPICGDAKKLPQEQCDDGNLIDHDGCSQLCLLELSYECTGGNITTPDICIMTCGNNLRTGIEQCDDGNLRNGDGCSSLCQIETTFGCQAIQMQDGVMRDECFQCVSHCALCTDTTIESCTLCQQGYYKSIDDCTDKCDIGYYPDFSTQQCTKCQDNCNHCYSTTQCYNCANNLVLTGTNCVAFCDDGYWVKSDDLKGNWCKKCPDYCLTCDSDTQCTKCVDYYGIDGICKSCQMGDLCLSCDFNLNHCTNCQLGYRPINNSCLLITDKCGDGLVSLNEACDDMNLVNGDGCSRQCTIEDGHQCRLLTNQGPSQCFEIDGWDFTLQSFILDPTVIQINFRDPLQYHEKMLTNNTQVFGVSISGYSNTDFSYEFVNISSNQSLQIKFKFFKNVVSQSLTVNVIEQTLLFNEFNIFINPNKISVSINLEDVEYYSNSQINNFVFFAQVCQGLQIVNWILTVGAGFLGQKMRMWKIIEIMQIIAVMYYINLRSYPMNDELILKDLRNSNLQILPNYIEQQTDEYLDSLRRFSYAGMTHQILNNIGGRFILSLAASIGSYLIIKLIYYKYILFVFEVFLDKLEFSYFFKLYEVFLLELLIGCFHNLKYNSMASNWDGTNTVCALLLLLFILLFQITQFLVMYFRDKFGTEEEVELMFGTLTDGFQDHDNKRRVYLSQQDFVKKFFIAFAVIYVNDPFEQLLFIIIPRVIITIISIIIMQSWFIRVKEIISELLLYGIFGIVYLLAMGNYIGDLDTKVFYGYLWVYLVVAVLALHFFIDTYLVWKLLQDLEFAFPAVFDPSEGLNKKVDLFKLRPGKDKRALPAVFQEDMDQKVGDDEAENRRRQKLLDEQNKKNQNREQWNVWDMNREALPEERKFVSINHNELNPYENQQQEQQQIQQEEIINFDELDQFYDNPIQNNNQFGITNHYNNNNHDQSKDDESSGIKDNPFDF